MAVRFGKQIDKTRPQRSYGKSGWCRICGVELPYASLAEFEWLSIAEKMLFAGEWKELEWQPEQCDYQYQFRGRQYTGSYNPDAKVTDKDGAAWLYEIKHGRIEQNSQAKMLAYLRQEDHLPLVLVWKGRIPTRGPTAKRLEKLRPHISHIWELR